MHLQIFWTKTCNRLIATCVLVLGVCAAGAYAAAPPIAASEIVALEQALAQIGSQDPLSVATRRLVKNTARKGLALVAASPDAPNRFAVLGIVFECQKRLVAVANTARNRAALFDICEKLATAPDAYARLRLEGDLLLSDRDLSASNATREQRAAALAALIERYRGTSAEARCLLMGALIVQKLDAPKLEDAILYALDENFSDDTEVIAFRSRHLKTTRLDVTFKGAVDQFDGTTLRFPADTTGHMSLMVFWSTNTPGYEAYLERTKKELSAFPGRVGAFSFNLDELPDSGRSILHDHGLDWTVLQLPGGKANPLYRTYAQGDPVSVLVNEYGLAVIRPEIVNGRMRALDPARVSEARYSAQLQSLFIGDFLVTTAPSPSLNTQAPNYPTTQAIQACFPPPPLRYRLAPAQALDNYQRAVQLCSEALKKQPDSAESQHVRERLIIALLGMWNMACDPEYLAQAVVQAQAALAATRPTGAQVVPRFCLAKAALRDTEGDAEGVVRRFLADCGGADAPAAALAAATILALEAKSRDLHEQYRGQFLQQHADDPAFYAFTSFLRDRHHRYRLLRPNYARRERGARGYIVAHGYPHPTEHLPEIALRRLDGSTLTLPQATNGKLTYLLFVEPPADPTADFPLTIDSRGNAKRNDPLRTVMRFATNLTASHVNKDIEFITAFLTDDADHVRFLTETNGWDCQAVMVPGGLENPMVRQLGILSADRLPNIFLLRRDGAIAWRASGLTYQAEFGFPFAFLLALKVHTEVCDVEAGYRALQKEDYQEAVRRFAGPFEPARPDRYGWLSPRYHGKALGYIGLQDWDAALATIDKAIDAHKLRHFHGRRSKKAADWQQDAATVVMKEPCDVLPLLWQAKARILDQLGRKEDANALRKQCEQPVKAHRPSPYSAFHERLMGGTESDKGSGLRVTN